MSYLPRIEDVIAAKKTLEDVVATTPLLPILNLSERYGANIMLKREDLQIVRSYKIRGAYNKIKSLPSEQLELGVVCASAGNHAQGVAYSCYKLGIKGTIYMPTTTPKQKISQVRFFGRDNIDIVLTGDTFDASSHEALAFAQTTGKPFIHPVRRPEGNRRTGYNRSGDIALCRPADRLSVRAYRRRRTRFGAFVIYQAGKSRNQNHRSRACRRCEHACGYRGGPSGRTVQSGQVR